MFGPSGVRLDTYDIVGSSARHTSLSGTVRVQTQPLRQTNDVCETTSKRVV